jgi:hypothetical protein
MADLKISALTSASTPLAGTEVLPIVQSSTTVKVTVANLTLGRSVGMSGFDSRADGLLLNSAGGAVASKKLLYGSGALVNQASTYGFTVSATAGRYYVATAQSGTGVMTDRYYADENGNLNLIAGNVVIGTSGKGIDFSATSGSGTSELLADYEEGTWTPALNGSTPGTVTATVSGTYTKIGRTVFCTFSIVQTSAGAGTGDSVVSGLPFAISSQGAGSLGSVQNLNSVVSRIQPYGSSGSSFYLFGMAIASASDTAALPYNTYIKNNTQLYGNFSYITA